MNYAFGNVAAAGNLVILYSSDTQGNIRSCGGCPKEEELGGLARRASYLKSIEDKVSNCALVEVGDVLGDMKEKEKKADVIFRSISQMGYDVMNLGEMDFSSGRTVLENQVRNLSFPAISANILDTDTGRLFAAQPYIIKTVPNGLRIGIIGVLSDKFPIRLPPGEKELRAIPAVDALQQYLPEVDQESDIVIVLSHLGIFDSTNLARSVSGIDVIISGHGGHGIEKPIVVNDTIIVQTRDKGTHLGRLDLALGEDGKILSYKNQLIPLGPQYKDDPTILKILNEYKEPVVARWDIGDAKEGETYEKVIEVKNTGQAPLVIHKARPSCECLSAEVVKKMAMPGEAATIRAKLIIEGLNREFEKYIYLQSNDAEKPVTAIAVSGKIVGPMKTEKEKADGGEQEAESDVEPDHSKPLTVVLFYSSECEECYKIKDILIPQVEKELVGAIEIEKYDISDMSNYELLMRFEDRYGVEESSPMVLFVGDKYLAGTEAIEQHLKETIEEVLGASSDNNALLVPVVPNSPQQ